MTSRFFKNPDEIFLKDVKMAHLNQMSEIFTQTSDKPYLNHTYKLIFKNNKFKIFDNYQDLLQAWFNSQKDELQFVEILDIPKKGFK